jgi:hypothetical protein
LAKEICSLCWQLPEAHFQLKNVLDKHLCAE